jgi:autotransporter translocation and assembly factor TamB
LHVTGTMLEPSLSLSSDPQLAESDLICYVFFSSPCVSVTGSQGSGAELGTQLARDQVLGTVSSSLSSVLVGETGLDYLDIRSSASVRPYGTSTGSESFFSDTEVEIGKYLSRDVFVSVRQAIGRAVPPAVRVEYKFGESWTAVARTERYLSDQLIRNYANFTTKQLVGVSLFREWDF